MHKATLKTTATVAAAATATAAAVAPPQAGGMKLAQPPVRAAAPAAAAPIIARAPAAAAAIMTGQARPAAIPAAKQPVIDVQATVVASTPVSVEQELAGAPAVVATAPVAAPARKPAPAPAPAPVKDTTAEEANIGYQAALNGLPSLPEGYTPAMAEGWNRAIEAGLYGTQNTPQPTPEPEQPAQAEATAPEPPAQTSTALAVRPPSAMSRVSYADNKSFFGDWGQDDLRWPTLKIVSGSGPLSKQFNESTVLLANTVLLPPTNIQDLTNSPLLKFIPLQFYKQYRERLSDEEVKAGAIARTANTIAEVEELGGTTIWGNGNEAPPNYWGKSARCVMLIQRPHDGEGADHPSFNIDLDGELYAVAVFYAGGTAFSSFPQVVMDAAQTQLLVPVIDPATQLPAKNAQGRVIKESMIYKNFWSWTVRRATLKKSTFSPWQPTVKLLAKEETGPELRDYCANLLGANTDTAAAAE